MDYLNRLPQTIYHFDVFRRNLFARKMPDDVNQTLVLDWAFMGQGAVGEEISPLVLASFAFYEIDLDQVQVLEEIVFEGYLEGLHQAGWRGDPRQVRLGYTAASFRYRFTSLDFVMEILLDESMHYLAPQIFGYSLKEVFDHWFQVGSLVDKLTDEARELMNILEM